MSGLCNKRHTGPTITVVIPTCDRPHLLTEAIACVLNQSRKPDEVIVVNNGKVAVDAHCETGHVTVCELAHYSGAARARNYGVEMSGSDYVAFLDDDDLWEDDYLLKVASEITTHQPDCIITRLDRMSDGLVRPYKNADGKLKPEVLFVTNPGIGGQTTVVRRESFCKVGGYDVSLPPSEDKSLVVEFLLHGYSVVTAPHIQAIVRDHDGIRMRDPQFMHVGIRRFVRKYGKYMTWKEVLANWTKIFHFRYADKRALRDRVAHACCSWLGRYCPTTGVGRSFR